MPITLGDTVHAGTLLPTQLGSDERRTAIHASSVSFADGTSQSTAGGGGGATYDANNRLNASFVGDGTVSDAEFAHMNGVTSNIQSQLTANETAAATAQSTADAKVEVPVGLGYAANASIVRNAANTAWTQAIKYGEEELGTGSGLQVVGTVDVNLGTNSLKNNAEIIAVNGASTASNANKCIVTDGSGTLEWSDADLVPSRSTASANDVLTYNGTNMVWTAPSGGGNAVYFSGRLNHAQNAPLTTQSSFTFSQLTALTPFANANSSTVTWNNGAVTIPSTGVYVINWGINAASTVEPGRIVRLIGQIKNGSSLLCAGREWHDNVNTTNANCMWHILVNGSWLGHLSQGDVLVLEYNCAVASGGATVTEYSTSAYAEYGKTYFNGFKISP
jgi:hypothetical protein